MTAQEDLKRTYHSEEFVAEFMGFSSLASFRVAKSNGYDIPPYVKIGRKTWFPIKEFESWKAKRKLIRPVA